MAVNDDIPTDIRRQNEIQSIPIYSGNVDDQPFNVWLRDAEATALVNDWPRDATKKYLASRLKGTAYSLACRTPTDSSHSNVQRIEKRSKRMFLTPSR